MLGKILRKKLSYGGNFTGQGYLHEEAQPAPINNFCLTYIMYKHVIVCGAKHVIQKCAVRDIKAKFRDRDPAIEEHLIRLELKFYDPFSTFAGHLYFFSFHVKT